MRAWLIREYEAFLRFLEQSDPEYVLLTRGCL